MVNQQHHYKYRAHYLSKPCPESFGGVLPWLLFAFSIWCHPSPSANGTPPNKIKGFTRTEKINVRVRFPLNCKDCQKFHGKITFSNGAWWTYPHLCMPSAAKFETQRRTTQVGLKWNLASALQVISGFESTRIGCAFWSRAFFSRWTTEPPRSA